MSTKTENTNVLEGMKCPQCGSLEAFNIECTTEVTMRDEGCEDYGDCTWQPASRCVCNACSFLGTVADFTLPDEDEAAPYSAVTFKPMEKEPEKSLHKLVVAAKCALADLVGIMPQIDPGGERNHPGWKTIDELTEALQATDARLFQ